MVQPGAYASGNYAGHLMESHISTDPPESNPRGQQFPNTPLEMESESTSKATNRKRAHNQIEKRYREGLNSKFLQLEDVLRNRHDHILPDQQSKRSKRAEVLEIAYDNILELQGEVRSLKKKLEILRKAALPSETWKFTLGDDDSIKPV